MAKRGQSDQGPCRLSLVFPRWFEVLALGLLLGGCAGYSGSVKEVRTALLSGDKSKALDAVNRALDVDRSDEMPKKLKGDKALLVLERATVKQGLDNFKGSSADFRAADKHLELLDLQNDTPGNIGKYLFSDDTTVYKAPAYEKLLLNTMNMINYLSLNNLEAARVEARRLRIMQNYLADEESEQASLLGLGSYFAGFAFDMSGQAEKALAHYDGALVNGDYPSLGGPIRRLAACTNFRTDRITRSMGKRGPAETCQNKLKGKGTILVVTGVGLAPHKVAKRIPIGAALVIAGAFLGALETAQAQKLAARGLLTFINFPVMEKTWERFDRTRISVDNGPIASESGLDVTARVIRAWDSIKGKLMVAAITRMVTRLVAGIAAEQAVKGAGGNPVGAILAGLAVQGVLTVADTPDTRSWVTLPSRVYLARVEVPPGIHEIEIAFEGKSGAAIAKKKVKIEEGGYAVVFAASMR